MVGTILRHAFRHGSLSSCWSKTHVENIALSCCLAYAGYATMSNLKLTTFFAYVNTYTYCEPFNDPWRSTASTYVRAYEYESVRSDVHFSSSREDYLCKTKSPRSTFIDATVRPPGKLHLHFHLLLADARDFLHRRSAECSTRNYKIPSRR